MKVLLLYASFGGGHLKAAESLKEYFEEYHSDYELMFLDAMKYTSPEINNIILKSYVQLAKNMPKAWEKIYNLSDQYSGLTDFTTLLNKIVSGKFKQLVLDFNPDIIICTHPFAVDMLHTLKKKNTLNAKVGLVLTDYAPHAMWLTQPNTVDAFFVAHEGMIDLMEIEKINTEKVFATGIPVLKAFHTEYNRTDLLQKFNLEDKFTLLFIPGGEYGMSKNSAVFKDIIRIPNIQIIAVTGKNEKLKNKFKKIANNSNKNIKILGYTNEIAQLLYISNIIISKTGGLTTTESIVSHTPMVVLSPLPGQEEHNSNYILNNGLGYRLFENCNKLVTLKNIINNTERIKQIIHMCELLAKPNASKDICEKMIELCKKEF